MSSSTPNNLSNVTVIIATTAEKTREQQINRAISSVLSQQHCQVTLLMVVNGNRFDPKVRATIENNENIVSHYLVEGNFPKALMYARGLVETDFFCFLDDDDELLPLSLASRLTAFDESDAVDIVVGNGLKKYADGREAKMHSDIMAYQQSPLNALLQKNGNWLASCAGMFRTSAIPYEYFSDYAVYAEWTYVAFKLAIYKKVTFTEHLCYRINVSTESLSHNEAYLAGQYAMTDKVLALDLPTWVKASFIIKRRDMEHDFSERYLSQQQIKKAWSYHLKSLTHIKTFTKYFLFTRYLLRALLVKKKRNKA